MSKSRQLTILVIAPLAGLFLFGMGNSLFMSFVTIRLDAQGISSLAIGWVSSAFHIGLVIGALFSDRLLIRVGHIRSYACFTAVLSITVLAQGLYFNVVFWFMLRLLAGWAALGVYLVIESWILSATPTRLRGRILAFYMISLYGAGAIGQLLLSFASNSSNVFIIVAILISLSALPLCIIPRATPLIEKSVPMSLRQLFKITPTGVVGCFGAGILVSAIYSLLPLYLQHSGYDLPEIGKMMALVIFGAMLLQYPIGLWSDRHNRQSALIATSIALGVLSAILATSSTTSFILAALLLLVGGSAFVLYPVAISHAADRTPVSVLIQMSQGLLLVNELGAAISPTMVSLAMKELGDKGLFLALGGVAAALALFFLWRRKRRSAPHPASAFTSHPPVSVAGAELNITETMVKGANKT